MDTFSHILIAFLLLGRVDIKLALFAGVVALVLDLDYILTPLARRFPILEHRGFTHSVLVVLAIALIAAWIFSALTEYTYLPSMIAGCTGAFTHIIGDTLGNYGTGTLWPFIKRYVKLDITLGVDPLTIAVSMTSLPLLFVSYRNANFQLYDIVFLLAALFFSLYFLIRISLKVAAYHKFKTKTLPMFNPLKYKLLDITDIQRGNQKYKEYRWRIGNLISGQSSAESTFALPLMEPTPPLETDEQLIAYSHNLRDLQRIMVFSDYHICEILQHQEEGAVLLWYALELANRRFKMGALVRLSRDGTAQVKRYTPLENSKIASNEG
jgi:membrane-bound metal-dependent hydrolase YbcI (DUF457 family)